MQSVGTRGSARSARVVAVSLAAAQSLDSGPLSDAVPQAAPWPRGLAYTVTLIATVLAATSRWFASRATRMTPLAAVAAVLTRCAILFRMDLLQRITRIGRCESWGIVFAPNAPVWVADNRTGVSLLYDGFGDKLALVVTIPTAKGGTPPGSAQGV